MGYEIREIGKVSVVVSRHGSDQDQDDDGLAEELARRIRMIVMEHKYAGISAMFTSDLDFDK